MQIALQTTKNLMKSVTSIPHLTCSASDKDQYFSVGEGNLWQSSPYLNKKLAQPVTMIGTFDFHELGKEIFGGLHDLHSM